MLILNDMIQSYKISATEEVVVRGYAHTKNKGVIFNCCYYERRVFLVNYIDHHYSFNL